MSEAAVRDFAAFERLVADDPALVARLRPIMDREAFIAVAVAEGAACGLTFTPAEIEAVFTANRHGWLLAWLPDA